MIDMAVITCAIIVALIAIIVLSIILSTKKDVFVGIIVVCSVILMGVSMISVLTVVDPYFCSINLPQKYIAQCNAVEDTEEMLMKYENMTGIGSGLEALELKQRLGEMIEEKYRILGNIRAWLNNPIMPFKDNIISGLGIYSLDI